MASKATIHVLSPGDFDADRPALALIILSDVKSDAPGP